VSIPNLITLVRIVLVPVVVWAILANQMGLAFALFLAAGVSDGVDGFIAKRFGMTTVLGAYLDPLADKALLVSIYVTLGINNELPLWLVLLVVSRDIMIVGGVLLSWLLGSPMKVKPLIVSKLNTLAQIVLASVVLGALGLGLSLPWVTFALIVLVALTTVLSIAACVSQWLRHMNAAAASQ
jgi:cardiolipin synthase (CMP-forming)